jgi:hypothetical protein
MLRGARWRRSLRSSRRSARAVPTCASFCGPTLLWARGADDVVTLANKAAIRRALENAGIDFIEDNGGGELPFSEAANLQKNDHCVESATGGAPLPFFLRSTMRAESGNRAPCRLARCFSSCRPGSPERAGSSPRSNTACKIRF